MHACMHVADVDMHKEKLGTFCNFISVDRPRGKRTIRALTLVIVFVVAAVDDLVLVAAFL